MTNYYKYLPVSRQDEDWGLHVLNAGCTRIETGQEYPAHNHPDHHYFNWKKGRVLQEFQLVYITKGEGHFESRHCGEKNIVEGTVFILFPGEWHRFRPEPRTGWDEYWVGFDGNIPADLLRNNFFPIDEPSRQIGLHENILQLFIEIIESTRQEKAGYQPLVSGAVLHLLGTMYSLIRQKSLQSDDLTVTMMSKAKVLLRSADFNFSIERVADELGVSYSWFRKTFKEHTGMAPGQYLQQLRIEQAKIMLADPRKPLKQIAAELNFESAFYFSALFKKKMGSSPEQYRKILAGVNKIKSR
jgi:AraC-like DNA-binding protein